MSNQYFKFKQFEIAQENCAMKVCTDSCLLGAIAVKHTLRSPLNILDIGAGTGLLSLMLAQKFATSKINAVEIDKLAFDQMSTNFKNASFQHHCQAIHADVKDIVPSAQLYDLIISNPPYFDKALKSQNERRNLAMHQNELSLNHIALIVQQLLKPNGLFWLLIPYTRLEEAKTIFQLQSLFVKKQFNIYPHRHKPAIRAVLMITAIQNDIKHTEVCIKNTDDTYSNDFIDLLKDYYLYLK